MTDRELVLSCLQGGRDSYQALMDRYSGYAMTVALHVLMNREDAEDVCQEAFFKAFRFLDRFDMTKSFKNWLYALLYNLCLDHIRKKKRSRDFLSRYPHEHQASPVKSSGPSGVQGVPDWPRLRCLSPKERMALYLWSQEGYSGAEMASVLGCSAKTAHVHLFRARQKLKALLRENPDE